MSPKLFKNKITSKQKSLKLPPLIFITDDKKVEDIFCVIKKLPQNSIVIIRDYSHPEREYYAKKIAEICKTKGIKFLVAGDLNLAKKLKSDGIHIKESMTKEIKIWKLKNKKKIITVSAHNRKTIKKFQNYNIDAILLSPVFKTTTHPNSTNIGIKRFKDLAKESKTPIYALGGVSKKNIAKLKKCNITGIAGIDLFR